MTLDGVKGGSTVGLAFVRLSEHQVTVGRLFALYAVAGQIRGQELDRDRASDGGL